MRKMIGLLFMVFVFLLAMAFVSTPVAGYDSLKLPVVSAAIYNSADTVIMTASIYNFDQLIKYSLSVPASRPYIEIQGLSCLKTNCNCWYTGAIQPTARSGTFTI